MTPSTRDRLIQAASQLFASHGFKGAPVRDICNLARTNPGAVSYHFGGKRQLYRTVLRQAAQRLATSVDAGTPATATDLVATMGLVLRAVSDDPVAARLLLRDLADGGTVAVEALEPTLRASLDALSRVTGHTDLSRTSGEVRMLFLELAGPLFLLIVAWPVLARPLELEEGSRLVLLKEMVRRVVAVQPHSTGSTV